MSQRTKILLQLLVVVILCGVAAWALVTSGALRPRTGSRALVIRVEAGGGFASVTLDAGSKRLMSSETITTPWEKRLTVDSGTEVYLTTANPVQNGNIQCEIRVDNSVWKQDKAKADEDGVACAGIVP